MDLRLVEDGDVVTVVTVTDVDTGAGGYADRVVEAVEREFDDDEVRLRDVFDHPDGMPGDGIRLRARKRGDLR